MQDMIPSNPAACFAAVRVPRYIPLVGETNDILSVLLSFPFPAAMSSWINVGSNPSVVSNKLSL